MKAKSWIALALALSLAPSIVGCAGSPNASAPKGSDAAPAANTAEPAAPAEEPTVYTVMVSTTPDFGDWNEMWLIDYIRKEFNIDFQANQVSSDGFEEKKNLAFATNNLPDLFMGSTLTATEMTTYGAQGQIIPLEPYFTPELMPNFTRHMDENPNVYRAHFFPDGHAYSVWGYTKDLRSFAMSKFWVNIDWAQKTIGKVPETTDEFYEYLVGVKNGDLNGNGDPNDEIPLGGIYKSEYGGFYDGLIGMLTPFGFADRRLQAIDGKVWLVPTHPNYKEFLKYMNKLYEEGLLDAEYFSQSEDQRQAKISQQRVAAYSDWAQWLYTKEEPVWQQWQAIDPLTSGVNATKMWPAADCTISYMFSVTKNCKDVEKLMGFVDWLYTDDGSYINWYGPKKGMWAEHPEWGWEDEGPDAEGKHVIKQYWPEDKYDTQNAFLHDLVSPWAFPSGPASFEAASETTAVTEKNLTENVEKHYVPYYTVAFPMTARSTQEESDELSLLTTDLDSYIDQTVSKMIIGDIDIDAEFDNFVKECMSRGGDRYTAIHQQIYDRWASN